MLTNVRQNDIVFSAHETAGQNSLAAEQETLLGMPYILAWGDESLVCAVSA